MIESHFQKSWVVKIVETHIVVLARVKNTSIPWLGTRLSREGGSSLLESQPMGILAIGDPNPKEHNFEIKVMVSHSGMGLPNQA